MATAGAAETKDFPMRDGLPPICPVACPNPEKPEIGPEATGAGAAAGGAEVAPVACPNPENPGIPLAPTAGVAAGAALPGLYPPRACPSRAVFDCSKEPS